MKTISSDTDLLARIEELSTHDLTPELTRVLAFAFTPNAAIDAPRREVDRLKRHAHRIAYALIQQMAAPR